MRGNHSGKKIILYGTGQEGEKFYFRYKDEYEIAYCFDSNSGRTFHGLEVLLPDTKKENEEYLIVVAVIKEYYNQISQKLISLGYVEYVDYVWTENFEKEIAILYGNCHTWALADYLKRNPFFHKTYAVFVQFVNGEKLPDILWEKAGLLIYQDIRKDNSAGAISAEDAERMAENAVKIKIPNLYGFYSFFPQSDGRRFKTDEMSEVVNHFSDDAIKKERYNDVCNLINNIAGRDYQIDFMYARGNKVSEILDVIENERIWPDIEDRFIYDIEKLKEREKKCSVNISEFILHNYRDLQLFYDQGHPTNEIICEYGRNILNILEIPVYEKNRMQTYLDSAEVFIYGCVRETLKCTWTQSHIRMHSPEFTLTGNALSLTEYVKQYLCWNYGGNWL